MKNIEKKHRPHNSKIAKTVLPDCAIRGSNPGLIKFEVIQGTSVGKVLLETSFLDESYTKLRMRTLNGAFGPGTYKVSMYVSKDGQLQKVEKEFIID